VGKKKHREGADADAAPSKLDRIFASKPLTIVVGIVIVAVFAGLGILVVTLLGGADDPANDALRVPAPVGPPPDIGESAAADLLADKTWDEMNAEERALVEQEIRRVFDSSNFRARSGFVIAVDVFRKDGETIASRTYPELEAPGGRELATQTLFYCTEPDGSAETYRYFVSSSQSDFYKAREGQYIPAWSAVMSGTDWSNVTDLGFRNADGLRLHGFEVDYTSPVAESAAVSERIQYWFDVESARLVERGRVIEGDDATTESNWYYLRYDELPPPIVPADLEQPPCVQEILATIAP
jgi:hypothetical protein